jgi:hypothetical protein
LALEEFFEGKHEGTFQAGLAKNGKEWQRMAKNGTIFSHPRPVQGRENQGSADAFSA